MHVRLPAWSTVVSAMAAQDQQLEKCCLYQAFSLKRKGNVSKRALLNESLSIGTNRSLTVNAVLMGLLSSLSFTAGFITVELGPGV